MSRSMIIACILLAANSASAELRPDYRRGYCRLWEHRDMQGARIRMPNGQRVSFAHNTEAGSTAWSERPDWNDVVSSATIDPGCKLQVWEHMEAAGASETWSGGRNGWRVNYVGGTWNDRISSATCYCD